VVMRLRSTEQVNALGCEAAENHGQSHGPARNRTLSSVGPSRFSP
jgi:hypothetical protein